MFKRRFTNAAIKIEFVEPFNNASKIASAEEFQIVHLPQFSTIGPSSFVQKLWFYDFSWRPFAAISWMKKEAAVLVKWKEQVVLLQNRFWNWWAGCEHLSLPPLRKSWLFTQKTEKSNAGLGQKHVPVSFTGVRYSVTGQQFWNISPKRHGLSGVSYIKAMAM